VKNCDLHAPAPTGAHLQGNPLAIQNMLFNLVLNAGQATGGRGRIDVRVENSAEAVTLAVHDDGPGVPDEKVRRVFDAFYSTRGEGHGLGLVAVTACAELHGGSVRVERSDLGGACFEVELPLDRNGNGGRRSRTLPAFTS
jgi:signal transduction histidine kinase